MLLSKSETKKSSPLRAEAPKFIAQRGRHKCLLVVGFCIARCTGYEPGGREFESPRPDQFQDCKVLTWALGDSSYRPPVSG